MQKENNIYIYFLFKILQQSTARKEQRINPAHVKDIKDTELAKMSFSFLFSSFAILRYTDNWFLSRFLWRDMLNAL